MVLTLVFRDFVDMAKSLGTKSCSESGAEKLARLAPPIRCSSSIFFFPIGENIFFAGRMNDEGV